ncbi:hypothetical protein NP233_g5007 [Leucocoprinus birnbaumii]|uniref:Uncharacterized protein n=1 Tax=Leucocoprinus birnbaumii TaxID=56174 RepID=A0AAD5VV28_9AGAR|nr:hypothetical protein NP233_g5007 [Leucocoprinus birnbaumii]
MFRLASSTGESSRHATNSDYSHSAATNSGSVQPSQQRSRKNGHTAQNAPKRQPLPVPARQLPKFRLLPNGIQRAIFEIAASEHNWRNPHVKRWIYISRNVREWIEPIVYESIVLPCEYEPRVLERDRKSLALHGQMLQMKPPQFIARCVRRIFTNSKPELGDNGVELRLLPICDNLESLECWSSPRQELSELLTTKHWPKLKILCLNVELLPKDKELFCYPLFQHLTHLDLRSEDALPSWKDLEQLRSLTHLRVKMMERFHWRQHTEAVCQAYTIAIEAQKSFPPNLKHFVILMSIHVIYNIAIRRRAMRADDETWKKFEDFRVGLFDPRILFGCTGDLDSWDDLEILEYDREDEVTQTFATTISLQPQILPTQPVRRMIHLITKLGNRLTIRTRLEKEKQLIILGLRFTTHLFVLHQGLSMAKPPASSNKRGPQPPNPSSKSSSAAASNPGSATSKSKGKKNKKNKKNNIGQKSHQGQPRADNKAQRRPVQPARKFPRFNDLPPEVKKRIFKFASLVNGQIYRHIDQWAYLSRQVKEWVEPDIYESIQLPVRYNGRAAQDWDRRKLESLERSLDSKLKEFFAQHVKRIFTRSPPSLGENAVELRLLSVCDNLETLHTRSALMIK